MVRAGREVRSWTEYIVGTDHCLFHNVSVRDPPNNSDHYLVIGCLRGLGGASGSPYGPQPPQRGRTDYLQPYGGSSEAQSQGSPENAWISAATWRIVNERVSARWKPTREQAIIRRLGRAINASLKG